MIIYGDRNSGNCLKVKYVADALSLAHTWVDIDVLKGESRTAEFLKLSDMGQVPIVKLDDGRVLAQSNAILRYLARGSKLLPQDPFVQARIDELLFWEQNTHEPSVAVCRFQMLYQNVEREAWRAVKGDKALDYMESRLQSATWFIGDAMSVADIALFSYTHVADEGGFDLGSRPAVSAWLECMEDALKLPRRRPRRMS